MKTILNIVLAFLFVILIPLSVSAATPHFDGKKEKHKKRNQQQHKHNNGKHHGWGVAQNWQNQNNDNNFICFSSLELYLPNQGAYELKIDENRYRDVRSGQKVGDIPMGKRFVSVWQVRRNRRTGQTERKMWFKGFLVFNDCQHLVASIQPNGQFEVNEVIDKPLGDAYFGLPMITIPSQFDEQQGVFYPPSNQNQGVPSCGMAGHIPSNGCCGVPPPAPQPQYMNDGSFNSFVASVANCSFDDTKIELAEMGLSQNLFTSEQIKQLLNQFSFENSKLKVAKMGYSRVVDPQNYTMIFPIFSFDSSVRELSEFMRNN